MKSKIILLFIFTFSCVFFAQAQTDKDSVELVQIETIDGNEFVGEIVKQDESSIVLKTNSFGEITILKSNIKLQKQVSSKQIINGKLWFENPQSTRYFWAPNGYGLKKGEGYYQNIYVFWNQFSYGVSDNFSMGGGVIPLFLFGGGPTPIFITPKVSIPIEKDKFNIGAGALIGTVLGESETSFGIVYGISTFGTPDKNVSFSFGYGFAGGEWAKSPLINVSGLFRLSSQFYFITENYYLNIGDEGIGLLGLGGRWIIKRASLDFILGIPVVADMGTFVALPAIGFSIPFGKTK